MRKFGTDSDFSFYFKMLLLQCEAREDYERCLITEYNAGKREGIELERENTEKERQRADDAVQRANDAVKRAAELEAEVKRLQELLQ